MQTSEPLPINEIFYTLQGEAHWSGTPAVFIRLQGCKVGCAFCDTKHTWLVASENGVSPDSMLSKTDDNKAYAWMPPEHIGAAIRDRWPSVHHVVLTGGEPADYDLRPLCYVLERDGRFVQIETSGTAPIRASAGAWVTVSPKIEMSGGLEVLESAVARANEIKHPTSTERHLTQLQALLGRGWHRNGVDIWIQPLSQNPLATQRCIEWCKQYGYRLSLQTHKYIMIR